MGVKPLPISNPQGRWSDTTLEYLDEAPLARVEVYEDSSREVVASNDSPDVGFRFSVNPYRGCMHACAYCYARPTHEYLDFGAGTDFDTRIVLKPRAPELLRDHFERPSWKGDWLAFSGVTDCYQPIESVWRLTRGCLEVCAEYRNPVCLVTKSPLIERDLDVLRRLATEARLRVQISIPFWDGEVARALEPGAAHPARRLQTVRALAEAGVDVGVLVAPLVPGLSEDDLAQTLRAAREAGATRASYVLLRLPGSVASIFESRLRATLPLRAERVLHRIRETRGGRLYDARFGKRGVGEGIYAQALGHLFRTTAAALGFPEARPALDSDAGASAGEETTFRRPPRPPARGSQLDFTFA